MAKNAKRKTEAQSTGPVVVSMKGKPTQKAQKSPAKDDKSRPCCKVYREQSNKPQNSTASASNAEAGANDDFSFFLRQVRLSVSLMFMLTNSPPTTGDVPEINDLSRSESNEECDMGTEKQILEVLIFLTSTTLDPLKVRALCIERSNDHPQSFILRISANHGDLQPVKDGLEKVIRLANADFSQADFAFWRNIDRPQGQEIDQINRDPLNKLLTAIIEMNFGKILCRLRSRHAKWKCNHAKQKAQRQSIIAIATEFVSAANDAKLLQVVEALNTEFEKLEKLGPVYVQSDRPPALHALSLIIKHAFRLTQLQTWSHLSATFPNHNTFEKLARYISVALVLAQDESIRRIVKALSVEIVILSSPAPVQPNLGSMPLTFTEALSDLQLSQTTLTSLQSSLVGAKATRLAERLREFQSLVNAKCAVHAEIQLLLFYEMNPHRTPPRMLISTKRPCFLCALFVRLHGRYTMPESHGRLYEKWTLPDCRTKLPAQRKTHMTNVIQEFTFVLVSTIENYLLYAKRGKIASMESFFARSSAWIRPAMLITKFRGSHSTSFSSARNEQTQPRVFGKNGFTGSIPRLPAPGQSHKLRRGEYAVIQPHPEHWRLRTVDSGNLHLSFANESHNASSESLSQRFIRYHPPILKIHRSSSRGLSLDRVYATTLDIARLKPGDEVVFAQEEYDSKSIMLRHEEDVILIQFIKPLDRQNSYSSSLPYDQDRK